MKNLTHLRSLIGTGLRGLTISIVLGAGANQALACDACNISFGNELQNERAGTLIARDMQAAFDNQSEVNIPGLGSGAFQPVVNRNGAVGADESETIKPAQKSAQSGSRVVSTAASQSLNRPVSGPDGFARGPSGAGLPRPLIDYDVPEEWENDPFIEVIRRDYGLPIAPTSYVPQDTEPDKSFTIELNEGKAYIGNGVVYDGFLTNGTVPGPLIVVDEGDIVEFKVVNTGRVPHGASIHSAYTQTSKYLGNINPGQTGRVVFRATHPGVYMYHCAPGGHAIPMHVLAGQYGMMVVKPKSEPYLMDEIMGQEPDIEIYLLQHEFYASGKDAIEGNALYTTFNGRLFRYVEEPIKARPGDFVRIYFLNVGPNLLSTFHIVGIVWDYVYWQGQPGAAFPGGQTVTAGPSDSFVIDFRIPPDEGAYTMLTHAVGSASRGAIGLIVAEHDAERTAVVSSEGPVYSEEEMKQITAEATRVISPFRPTNFDEPKRYPPGTKEVTVSIIGNSYWPKIIEIEPGTTVRWVNEDVFTYLSGEFSGIHNAQSVGGDDDDFFITPLLVHGESATHTFEREGVYNYICAPHPYMEGKIIVKKPEIDLSQFQGQGSGLGGGWLLPLIIGAFIISLFSLYRGRPEEKDAS